LGRKRGGASSWLETRRRANGKAAAFLAANVESTLSGGDMRGLVSLVGAGPGDPELLTIKAVRRLERADIVLHDALVSTAVLAFGTNGKRICVGKRAGRASISQEQIHELLIDYARQGLDVVRLKCGDPFVLGRGGEELAALLEAGIPFEIVPGISSAIAAPGLAGIPLTQRGISSAIVVFSGHCPDTYYPLLSGIAPDSATLVGLMSGGNRVAIGHVLVQHGWNAETPAAVIAAASLPEAAMWFGTLEHLAESPHDSSLPTTLVIGEVVSLAASLSTEGATHAYSR
jgi:uroporphyrin-III C-methyltransferase/precorrin-2 dehydrogenase/sirohydrochlorin ferrochelatase